MENISSINKSQILNAVKLLHDKGEFKDALLIQVMWSLEFRLNEMLTLRFEDFENKNNQKVYILLC